MRWPLSWQSNLQKARDRNVALEKTLLQSQNRCKDLGYTVLKQADIIAGLRGGIVELQLQQPLRCVHCGRFYSIDTGHICVVKKGDSNAANNESDS